jgi:hypothetical protein
MRVAQDEEQLDHHPVKEEGTLVGEPFALDFLKPVLTEHPLHGGKVLGGIEQIHVRVGPWRAEPAQLLSPAAKQPARSAGLLEGTQHAPGSAQVVIHLSAVFITNRMVSATLPAVRCGGNDTSPVQPPASIPSLARCASAFSSCRNDLRSMTWTLPSVPVRTESGPSSRDAGRRAAVELLLAARDAAPGVDPGRGGACDRLGDQLN